MGYAKLLSWILDKDVKITEKKINLKKPNISKNANVSVSLKAEGLWEKKVGKKDIGVRKVAWNALFQYIFIIYLLL